MEKKTYFMFVHGGDDWQGLWGEFPDLPGCMTDGDDLEELTKNAADALASWLESVWDKDNVLPEASDAASLKAKADASEDPVLFFLPVTGYLPGAPARINITSTEAKIAEITAFAQRVNRTRSELMVKATLDYIRSHA